VGYKSTELPKVDKSRSRIRAGHQWLMPVILATQDAEIRSIVVQRQSRQIVHETLSRKNASQNGLAE
jgi:hypothetical protein